MQFVHNPRTRADTPAALDWGRISDDEATQTNKSQVILHSAFRLGLLITRAGYLHLTFILNKIGSLGEEIQEVAVCCLKTLFYGPPVVRFTQPYDPVDPLSELIHRFPSRSAWFIR